MAIVVAEARRVRVYLSSPITLGDRNRNLYVACRAQKSLMEKGYAAWNPVLSMLAPFAWEKNPRITHETWIECDLAWVAVADCVLRIPGESRGADIECDYARCRGIPVYNSIAEVRKAYEGIADGRG